jgi:hypothetical protein
MAAIQKQLNEAIANGITLAVNVAMHLMLDPVWSHKTGREALAELIIVLTTAKNEAMEEIKHG